MERNYLGDNHPFSDQRPAMADATDLVGLTRVCEVWEILAALMAVGDTLCSPRQLLAYCGDRGIHTGKLAFLLKILVTRFQFPNRGDVHPWSGRRQPGFWLTQRWMYGLCFPWVWALAVLLERVFASDSHGGRPGFEWSAVDLAAGMQRQGLAVWHLVALSRDRAAMLTLPEIPDVAFVLKRVLVLKLQHEAALSRTEQGAFRPLAGAGLVADAWRSAICTFGFHAACSLLRAGDDPLALLHEPIRQSPFICNVPR